MKKVVLLGDSIRLIGYGKRVEELLGDQCTVWQPEDNCRFSKYTLRMLFDEQQNIKDADVIHWNNGLWDACDILETVRLRLWRNMWKICCGLRSFCSLMEKR